MKVQAAVQNLGCPPKGIEFSDVDLTAFLPESLNRASLDQTDIPKLARDRRAISYIEQTLLQIPTR